MRFDLPESIAAMRAGAKTQTRRRNAYWMRKKRGDRITVVHKGKYLGWTKVVRVWELGNVLATSTEEAQAEGYESSADFIHAWAKLYGEDTFAHDTTIVAIEFEAGRWKL